MGELTTRFPWEPIPATPRENPDFICVMLLGSGYAAIHMRWYADVKGYDIQQTGLGRYRTLEKANQEAQDWSQADEIELRL